MAILGNSLKSGVFSRTNSKERQEIGELRRRARGLKLSGLQIDDISHLMNTDPRQISLWLKEIT